MSKRRIILGDTHGRSFWKLIKEKEEWDEMIFIGDYFDSFDFSGIEQIANFKDIVEFKKSSDKPVILLIGNHDHHYFPEIGYSGTSGYQAGIHTDIEFVINENRKHLRMAYAFDDVLCSHAGVGEAWMERIVRNKLVEKLPDYTAEAVAEWTNEIWKYKPLLFKFTGEEPTGNNMGQTPIWIRPLSLTKDSHELRKTMKQVVGHTRQHKIDLDPVSTLKGRYFFIDTLGTSKEYLIHENGEFSTNKC